MKPIISVVVHDMCVLSSPPDNIHYHFTSHIRGCLIYRVFRGAKWANRLISPWEKP